MEQVVGVEHDAAGLERGRLEGGDERPAGVQDGVSHADVVTGTAIDDVLVVVAGVRSADGNALHATHLVGEIEVVGAGEVVVVLFVVQGPVLGVGHRRRGPVVLPDFLGVVEHLDLHGLVVAVLAAVVGTVVVLVPVLVVGTAGEGGVVGEGHDGPVLPHQAVARGDHPGCLDDVENLGNQRSGDVASGLEGFAFLVVDHLVDAEGNTEVLRRQHDQPAAREVPQQTIGGRVQLAPAPDSASRNLVNARRRSSMETSVETRTAKATQ